MNTLTHFSKKYLAVAVILIFSTNVFSQARENAPAATAAPATGPVDYGKDASAIKLKKHMISFGFFSLLNQHISFGYDQLLGTDVVLSAQIGIIGPSVTSNSYGNRNPYTTSGMFIEVGPKLFFSPDFVSVGTLRYNSMQGGYFKPEVIFSAFSTNQYSMGGTNQYSGLAVMLNFGKQWILAHSVSLDMYVGIGYGINANGNGTNEIIYNYYSYEVVGPLAFSAGLNLGLPF